MSTWIIIENEHYKNRHYSNNTLRIKFVYLLWKIIWMVLKTAFIFIRLKILSYFHHLVWGEMWSGHVSVRFTHAHLGKVLNGVLNIINNSAQHIRHPPRTHTGPGASANVQKSAPSWNAEPKTFQHSMWQISSFPSAPQIISVCSKITFILKIIHLRKKKCCRKS